MTEYTIKQISEELSVSKSTVKYRLKQLPKETIRKDEKGKIWVSEAGYGILESMYLTGQTFDFRPVKRTNSLTTGKQGEDKNSGQTLDRKADKLTTLTGQTFDHFDHSETEKILDLLRDQLKQKDEQIASLQKTLDTVTAENARLVQSLETALQNEQLLHAGTIKKQLSAPDQEEPPEGSAEYPAPGAEKKETAPKGGIAGIFSFLRKKR